MKPRFRLVSGGIAVHLDESEARLLEELGRWLSGLGPPTGDPGAERLASHAYPDDPEADAEWRAFVESELEAARRSDRAILASVTAKAIRQREVVIPVEEAEALVRVVNDARLVLGARWGIRAAEDYDSLRAEAAWLMSFLGWLVGELSEVLTAALERQ